MRAPLFVWEEFPSLFRGRHRALYRLEHHRLGITDMRVDQVDDRAYFTDATGLKWRVHDVAFETPYALPYHYHRFAAGDGRAKSRAFVSAKSSRRSFTFVRAESRELSASQCALARSGRRRPRERPSTRQIEVLRGAEFYREELSITGNSALLPLPIFPPPQVLQGARDGTGIKVLGVETILYGPTLPSTMKALGVEGLRISFDHVDVIAYARLLAKIAFGFAIAQFGLFEREESPVIPSILDTFDDIDMWIGSAAFQLEIETRNPTHALGFRVAQHPTVAGRHILIAQVKLFANCGASGYEIIVWAPKSMPPLLAARSK